MIASSASLETNTIAPAYACAKESVATLKPRTLTIARALPVLSCACPLTGPALSVVLDTVRTAVT